MKTSSAKIILCALGACAALGANATGMGADSARITNGGTGFIGVTQSYESRQAYAVEGRQARLPAGEATTMINGRPNQNPEAPGMGMAMGGAPTQFMGNSGAMRAETGVRANSRNPSWGTPD